MSLLLDPTPPRSTAKPSTPAAVQTEDLRQFGALIPSLLDELLNSALLAATTASIANWIIEQGDLGARKSLVVYLPPNPTLYHEAALRLCMVETTAEAASILREYYDRLSFLRHLARDFSDSLSEGRFGPSSASVLAQSWRELCGMARTAVATLVALLGEDAHARIAAKEAKIAEILTAAENGSHPCVSPDGSVVVPFWAERRHLARSRVSLQAYFLVANGLQRAAVVDATETGLGVVGLTGIDVGMKIALIVRPGQTIAASVRWVEGNRCGLSLATPLPVGSPLLWILH